MKPSITCPPPLNMTTPTSIHTLEFGSRNTTGTWIPFDWEDPLHGPQSKGEVVTIRTGGATGGTLASGLWRTGPGIAGCNDDGTCDIVYSAPLGDETMVLLEGSAEVLATNSGKKYHFKAGDILAHPKLSCFTRLNLDTKSIIKLLNIIFKHIIGYFNC